MTDDCVRFNFSQTMGEDLDNQHSGNTIGKEDVHRLYTLNTILRQENQLLRRQLQHTMLQNTNQEDFENRVNVLEKDYKAMQTMVQELRTLYQSICLTRKQIFR